MKKEMIMKNKVLAFLAVGAVAVSMAVPTGAMAVGTTEVGAIPQASTVDGDDDKLVMMTIPANSWFDSATAGATIDNFDVVAKVLNTTDNTYEDVSTNNTLPYSLEAKIASGTNAWMLTGGTAGHKIGYNYKGGVDGTTVIDNDDGTAAMSIGSLTQGASTVDKATISGTLTIDDVDQLTADDAGQVFKDTLTFTFTKK